MNKRTNIVKTLPLLTKQFSNFAQRIDSVSFNQLYNRRMLNDINIMKKPLLSLISPQLLLTVWTRIVPASWPDCVLYSRHVNFQGVTTCNTTKIALPWFKGVYNRQRYERFNY